ncbi:hypothetical protein C8R46DRAFT_815790, partial [Mycena filopes]
ASLLEVFTATARNPDTASRSVLECGQHAWTYAELDTISTSLAAELTGCLPRVAVVSENHPYIFALMLAVWKLGGIFIPIDPHVPTTLLEGMINLVQPTSLFLSLSDVSNLSHFNNWSGMRVVKFAPEDCTIPALNEKHGSGIGPRIAPSLSDREKHCLYLFTSSASSPKNLKPVPFTHRTILSGCRSKLEWWRHKHSNRNMDGIRILGWAPWSHLIVGIGMTETAGAVFAGRAQDALTGLLPQGHLSDAEYSLIGSERDTDEGELVIKSKLLPHGYINFENGSFSIDEQGWVTFKTGDRYRRTADSKFVWLGRTTDFIQMDSGEYFDPRPIEEALRSSNLIRHACVIGDKFLTGASTAVWAIIELQDTEPTLDMAGAKIQIAQTLAPINRDLPPALRIAPSSVLILDYSEKIPHTKKGEVSRKEIEDLFGPALQRTQDLVQYPVRHVTLEQGFPLSLLLRPHLNPPPVKSPVIARIVGDILGVSDDEMLASMSFAELGMTSLLAIRIAKALNEYLNGQITLPSNVCYIHLDVAALTNALQELLDTSPISSESKPSPDRVRAAPRATEEIVIIGRAFRLPGSVDNDAALWDALTGKNQSIIAPIPPDRWDHGSFFPADICFNRAGLVEASSYDFGFFGLTSTEAYYVSPTMRLALEVAFQALENANVPVSSVKGSKMAVYVATKDDGFETLLNAAHGYDGYTRFYGTGRAPSTASGRISYLLDIHGPSLTIDTACSGGLVCIDQAVNYLQSGAAEMALVSSSNTHCWPGSFMFLTAQGMVSPNSHCAAFSSEADGYVPSEGAVAFVLKTRSAAERDHDRILATLKATEVSHNGRSQGLAAPNVKSQAALHRSILQKAGLDPAQIHVIEAHGTGTSLGDLSEIQGINDAFTSTIRPRPTGPLIVSASKSALGHTEPSAGLVGVLSTLLAFEKRLVPGVVHLHDDNPNQLLDRSRIPLLIPSRPLKIQGDRPHRAAVLSYGFSGTLADVILESPLDAEPPTHSGHTGPMVFTVSAKTSGALTAYIERYLSFLRGADSERFHAICYTSCPRGSVVFAFAGQGTQFPGMAAQLGASYSGFRTLVEKFGRQAQALCDAPIHEMLLGHIGAVDGPVEVRSDIDQICIFVYQYSMCRWLNEIGIQPGAVLGHSLGEITAAVVAGAMSFETGLSLVITRSHLLRPSPQNPAGMAALACSEAKVSTLLEKFDPNCGLCVSVFNGPQSCCVSGPSHNIDTLVAAAKQENIKAARLRVDQGFHSPCVDSAIPGLRSWAGTNSKSFRTLRTTLYSTFLGAPVFQGGMLDAEHWVDHARKPVLFSKAAAAMKENHSIATIVDLGPQTVISSLLLLNDYSGSSIVAVGARKEDNQEISFLRALATLYKDHHLTPDFRRLFSQRNTAMPFRTTDIPTYPFQRVRCYPTYIPSRHG